MLEGDSITTAITALGQPVALLISASIAFLSVVLTQIVQIGLKRKDRRLDAKSRREEKLEEFCTTISNFEERQRTAFFQLSLAIDRGHPAPKNLAGSQTSESLELAHGRVIAFLHFPDLLHPLSKIRDMHTELLRAYEYHEKDPQTHDYKCVEIAYHDMARAIGECMNKALYCAKSIGHQKRG